MPDKKPSADKKIKSAATEKGKTENPQPEKIPAEKPVSFLKKVVVFFKKDSAPNLVLVLTVLSLVVAFALGFVYQITLPIIEESEKEAVEAAMEKVLDADSFEPAAFDGSVYIGRKGGEHVGYAVTVAPAGYGGEISMLVGIDAVGRVTGVVILSHSETPGLGSKVTGESWLSEQFVGTDGKGTVGNGVDAISGATISSKAVTAGVTDAVNRVLRGGNVS